MQKSESELSELADAGLNHLYRGIESGSDIILKKINKGITAEQIIISGQRSRKVGMILSDFTLLGIGGKELSEENAIETAKVINAVNPEFIRVHHAAFKPKTKLGYDVEKELFALQSEEEIVREQRLFIEKLEGIDSTYINEHIVNLLLEVRGNLPHDKNKMLKTIDKYLAMSEEDKLNFAIGRRTGRYYFLADMKNAVTKKNVSDIIAEMKTKNPDIDFSRICNEFRATMI